MACGTAYRYLVRRHAGSCGFLVPKSCECYRACYRLYCARYGLTGVAIGRWVYGPGLERFWPWGSATRI